MIEFKGVDADGDHVFSIPPTTVLYFDECGGTKDEACWCFVTPSGFIRSAPVWYEPKIDYLNPEMGVDLEQMTKAVEDWIVEGKERYG